MCIFCTQRPSDGFLLTLLGFFRYNEGMHSTQGISNNAEDPLEPQNKELPFPGTRLLSSKKDSSLNPEISLFPQEEDTLPLNCWMAPGFSTRGTVKELIKQINGGYRYVDQTGFYVDPCGSEEWLSVLGQKSHQAMRHSLAYTDIADQVVHMLTVLDTTEELDIISLGPSSAFEECMLAQLLAEHFKRIRVFLIDVSDGLLEEALRNMDTVKAHYSNVEAYAIRGNFHNLWEYLPRLSKHKPLRRRLVVAFTIMYNLQDELSFLQNNFAYFSVKDLFLGDFIRTAGPIEEPEIIRQREARLAPRKLSPQTGWDQALDRWHSNILRRYCENFEDVRFDYDLDVHRCPVAGSYAVDKIATIRLKNGSERSLVIQRYKRFPEDQWVYVWQRLGWLPVNAWPFGRLKDRIVQLFQKNRGF